MKRKEFEHTIRAAAAILGTDELLVIGSQAIHASVKRLFPEAQVSIEADISALEDDDGTKADLIDGSIGELSLFQATYGYFAQGVTPDTAVLPRGWKKRLVPFSSPATSGVTAFCLEPHDLWISKAVAARPKDISFCRALLKTKLVRPKTLTARLEATSDIKPEVRKLVAGLIARK